MMNIASVCIETEHSFSGYEAFQAKDGCKPDATIAIEKGTVKPGTLIARAIEDVKIYRQSDGSTLLWHVLSPFIHPITISPPDDRLTIYAEDGELWPNITFMYMLRLGLQILLTRRSILSLHASCVELNGEALCFTGDSGMGKSTRAKAWVDGLGAQFISGDRPAIRLEAACNIACGVPWDGKEQIFRNVERPLHAILEVRRAPFTRLRRLTQEQAYRVLVRQCFIPMWDPDTAALAMVNVKRLCRITPVYRLFCGPDIQDARQVHDVLFHHPHQILEEQPDMKIKEGFVLRTVVDEHMVMPTGENIGRFGGAVVLNDVSAFAFEQLKRPISREDLLALILGEFDVDETTASEDLDSLLEQFRELGLLKD